jgi:hypothetical protein
VFGFSQGDRFIEGCLCNLTKHLDWIISSRRDLLRPNNVCQIAGNYFIMSQLMTWSNLDDLAFISQDYLVTDSGVGYSVHSMDASWIPSLRSVDALFDA